MPTSITTLSRTLYRSLLSNPKLSQISMPFSTYNFSSDENSSDSDDSCHNSDIDSQSSSSSNTTKSSEEATKPMVHDRPLENGLDLGIYKAILLGQVGQTPVQKRLKNGRTVTMFSLGTGGIRNNRRPFDNEDSQDYANRSSVQWHRVSIYPERLGDLVMQNAVPGSILYLEGNLETRVFTDPLTGLVRRIREVALRQSGRVVFLGAGSGEQEKASSSELKRAGYF